MRFLTSIALLVLIVGDASAFGRRRQAASCQQCYYSEPTSVATVGASGEFGQHLLALHNADRSSRGLAPLELDSNLTSEAQAAASEQARRGRLGHFLPIFGGQENAAWNYSSEADVHGGWMRSSGHRANVLGPWSRVGFGLAYSSNGPYWAARYR